TLLSRNNQPQNVQFPEVVEALRASLDRPAVVDGEIVCFDEEGRTSFRVLQQRFHLKDRDEVRARARRFPASVYLFDLLYLGGSDVRYLPLEERKDLLRGAVRWSNRVRWTEYETGSGAALLRAACAEGQEGIIGKRLGSRCTSGRSDQWVKIKSSAG